MKTDHNAVQLELHRLKRDGTIHAADVVEAARNPESAMHHHFTWDDSEAAAQWRLEQARRLLRVYVVREESAASTPIRAYVSLSGDRRKGGGYRHLADVLSSEELYQQLLADAFHDLRGLRAKYATLRELRPVFDAVKVAEQSVSKEPDQKRA